MTTFAIRRALDATYDEALTRVTEALKSEGFGVLTEIDIQRALQQKLGVDFRRYKKTMAATGNPKLVELAEAVKEKLTRALAKLE